MGGHAYLVGVLPTPGIAFMTQSMRADAGIVISASHNPFQDNGLKIFGGSGYKLTDAQEEVIEDVILNRRLADLLPAARDMGKAARIEDANGRYIVFLKNTFPRNLSMDGMKIVLDTANGATYRVALTPLQNWAPIWRSSPTDRMASTSTTAAVPSTRRI
jgi:phosphoglucosamine mutase